VDALEELVQSYPRLQEGMEANPYAMLGGLYEMHGMYVEAVDETRQAIQIVPDHLPPYLILADALLALGRIDEAHQVLGKAPTGMGPVLIHVRLYASAFLAKDSSGLAQQAAWLRSQIQSGTSLAMLSQAEAYTGRLREAQELSRRSVEAAIRGDRPDIAADSLCDAALREASFGDPQRAKQYAAEALKLAPFYGPQIGAALAFAFLGDASRAEALVHDLEKNHPLDSRLHYLWAPTIRLQTAVAGRSSVPDIEPTEMGSAMELGRSPFGRVAISCLYPVYLRGQAYLAAGKGSAAAAEFTKILDHIGIVWNCSTGVLAHLGLGRAYALESRSLHGADADAARVRALAAYKDFLTLWKDADPDIPILMQAKAEYAKLQ
jgi:eukaryotic-like serine/threonine-protein kinase